MRLLYSGDELDFVPSKSIFLAGPTPRSDDHHNWRPEALEILKELEFDGVVFLPIPYNGEWSNHIEDEMDWESRHLEMASTIVFWVPRDLLHLPALTTNIEFGLWVRSQKTVLGFPSDAPSMHYMHYLAKRYSVTETRHTLRETLQEAITLIDR